MSVPKLILLDRDGVVNTNRALGVRDEGELELIPGAAQAIRLLNEAGIWVALVTNQALVGRGEIAHHDLMRIHHVLQQKLMHEAGAFINSLFFCTSAEACYRRKPGPGMLYEAMAFFSVSPQESLMVGDYSRDIEAAEAACVPSYFIGNELPAGADQWRLCRGATPSLSSLVVALLGDPAGEERQAERREERV